MSDSAVVIAKAAKVVARSCKILEKHANIAELKGAVEMHKSFMQRLEKLPIQCEAREQVDKERAAIAARAQKKQDMSRQKLNVKENAHHKRKVRKQKIDHGN